MKLFCLIKYICLLAILLASGCTQTIKLYDDSKLSGTQPATLIFPISVHLKIDNKDVEVDSGGFAVKKQVKLPPDTYHIQWSRSHPDETYAYEGSGDLVAESGEKYEIKFDKNIGPSMLTGTSIGYKHLRSAVLDHSTWIENSKTKEVLIGRTMQDTGSLFGSNLVMSGDFFYRKKDYKSAIDYYQQQLKINPNSMDALNNLAWILATCSDENIREPALAIEYAKKACELSNYKIPGYIDTLATGYAANYQFTKAQNMAKIALGMAQMQNDPLLADQLQSRLELFEANKSFIEKN